MMEKKKTMQSDGIVEAGWASRPLFMKLISNSAFVGGSLFIVLLIVYSLFATNIFSMFQFQEILINGSAAMALAAVGEGFVIITGGFDLSPGAIMALINCLLTTQMTDTLGSQVFWTFICLGIGMGAGLMNGIFVALIGLPSIIVTLATMFIFSGCALLVLPAATGEIAFGYLDFWAGAVGGVIPSSAILIAIVVVFLIVIKKSSLGVAIFAIGSDENTAYMNGINVVKTKLLTYTIAGGFYGLAGVVLSANMGSGDPTVGGPLLLSTFAAVVIGGTPLGGGKGSFFGGLFGAGIMNLAIGVLFVVGVSSYWGPIFNGAILILAVFATTVWVRYVESFSMNLANGGNGRCKNRRMNTQNMLKWVSLRGHSTTPRSDGWPRCGSSS
jgi:ribose transport system permease protein